MESTTSELIQGWDRIGKEKKNAFWKLLKI
jgi:hypothetical protein